MSKSIKNILIVGVGVAMYLFTAYVYRHVSVFAEPLDQIVSIGFYHCSRVC
ncbi:hypothetical protein EMQU_2568 [Enterococcus mundtii QU 25]|uniref:Uncharacterized protein n=1 Tax=Enterococcus mundtii TaxID=53346 RepID=A0AAI8R8U1_ENTMU|nr:hypothetical protein EMQU_2568 [Enterococcus mundtii QU 25]BBM14398.1 uncharacterized protein EM151A_1162 [Enterococcus mundtii]GKS54870.1 hypothetical protein EMLAB_14850 [Enterococcus mundtii]